MSKTKNNLLYKFETIKYSIFRDVINNVEFERQYPFLNIKNMDENFTDIYVCNDEYFYYRNLLFDNVKANNLEINMKGNIDSIIFDDCVIKNINFNTKIDKIIFEKKFDMKILQDIIVKNKEINDNDPVIIFKSVTPSLQCVTPYDFITYPLPKILPRLKIEFKYINFDEDMINFIDENLNDFGTISCYACKKGVEKFEYRSHKLLNFEKGIEDLEYTLFEE